jgi:hypothetical protein
MSSKFTDPTTRQTFIVGMVEVLSQIVEMDNPEQKRALYEEMNAMNDEDLLLRIGVIETYFRENKESTREHYNKVNQVTHQALEENEKQNLVIENF